MKISKVLNIKRSVLLGLVATLGLILYVRAYDPPTMPLLHPQPLSTAQVPPRAARVSGPRVLAIRRVYGHSIVPGGIHSVEDLKRAIVADPLAAQHYAGFDVTKAYVTRLPHDGLYFLSYRLNHGIYFTSVLRLIRGGEEVLTDGNNFILTRCGNRIVFSLSGPVNVAQEPMDLNIVVAELPITPSQASESVVTPTAPGVDPELPAAPPTSASGAAPSGGGDGQLPVSYVPVGVAGAPMRGTPVQGTADDLDMHTQITLLICGFAAILAWRLVVR